MSVIIPNAHLEEDVTIKLEGADTVSIMQRDRTIWMDMESARALAFVLIGMTDAVRGKRCWMTDAIRGKR